MTTLHMETDSVRAMAGQLKQAAESMRAQTQSLNSSTQGIDWQGPSRDEFVMETEALIRQLDAQAEAGVVLAGRVESEVGEWESLGQKGTAAYANISQTMAGIGAAIVNVGQAIASGASDAVQDASEMAKEARYGVEALQNGPEFQKWWDNLDEDQREAFLRDQLKQYCNKNGISADKLEIVDLLDAKGQDARGEHQGDVIKIDIDNLRSDNPWDLLRTVIHESRHSVQQGIVDDYKKDGTIPSGYTKEQIETWKTNMDNYHLPEDSFESYRKQPVERDARSVSTDYMSDFLHQKSWNSFTPIVPDKGVYA